jgi:hypothetical protein
MANDPKDRLAKLLAQSAVNGLDFVEVANDDRTELHVHFLLAKPDLTGTVAAGAVAVTGGETIPTVPVQKLDWVTVTGHPVLRLFVAAPGDFSRYTLTVASTLLDPFFDRVVFSFKARCPSTLDCKPPPEVCPPPAADRPPIDYLAKDFNSFRKALSDFPSLRYPEWVERSEADFGVMLMEALCALADDLSYTQDRVQAEATLATATQRRSVVRHARLVDYEPRPATAARVLLQLDVSSGPIPSGLAVSTRGPDGTVIDFETGTGLIDPCTGGLDLTNYAVSPAWNRRDGSGNPQIRPYCWDDSEKCLRAGATEMSVENIGFGFSAGQALLIDTAEETSADPPRREVVHLLGATETTDPLYNQAVTRIRWRPADALKYDHDLTRTVLAGNLVPATQGRRFTEAVAVGKARATSPDAPLAIVRGGARPAPVAAPGCLAAAAPDPHCAPPPPLYLHTLGNGPLVWLAPPDGAGAPLPEVYVTQDYGAPGDLLAPWLWRRSLLDANPADLAYTTEPMRYSPTLQRGPGLAPAFDYDGDDGTTLRFGDGTFARQPDEGMLFHVLYRVGGGPAGDVAADSITTIDPAQAGGLLVSVTNPFPAAGGADAESNDQVRRLAPYAFRARQFRAVRPEDYNAAAQTLPWVRRAGTSYRWTGSWLTIFTTVEPQGTTVLPVDRHVELIQLLNRYRLAGYEAYAPPPHYAPFDVKVWVCARPDAFRGDVEAALDDALGAAALPDGREGFFYPDHFTFGDPLERSALEAAAQAVPSVAGVIEVQYRRRGQTTDFRPMPLTVAVGPGEVVLVESDPNRPDRGSVRVYVEGGK